MWPGTPGRLVPSPPREGHLSARTVHLPEGAEDDKVTAVYDKGVLAVRVPIGDTKRTGRTITIKA